MLLKFGVDIQSKLKLRGWKIQYGHQAAILTLTSLKLYRLLPIDMDNVLVELWVEMKGQIIVKVWKLKYDIWPPDTHFESDITKIQ